MRKSALVVFVKTPPLSPVKTRLADSIGVEAAREFYLLSVATIRATVERLKQTCPNVTAFWAVAEEAGLQHELWGGWSVVYQGEGSLGKRLSKVQRELSLSFDGVVIIGADSPQIGADDLRDAFEQIESNEGTRSPALVVGPAKDGGFYLVGSAGKLPASLWSNIRYSTSDAGKDLIEAGLKLGEVFTLTEELDVDTVEDLTELKKILPERSEGSAEQLALLEWLNSKSQVRGISVTKIYSGLAK